MSEVLKAYTVTLPGGDIQQADADAEIQVWVVRRRRTVIVVPDSEVAVATERDETLLHFVADESVVSEIAEILVRRGRKA